MRLTDKNAIRVALLVAIEAEESLIEAYRNSYTKKVDETEDGVKIARSRIKAFKRVLDRYYPRYAEGEMEKALKSAGNVSIWDLVKNDKPA